MTLNYNRVWSTMNDLELVTSKICSAREIIDSAASALQEQRYEKAESMIYAANEFLEYYLHEFDSKFKDAWKETVCKMNPNKQSFKDWESFYYPEEYSNSIKYTDEELDAMCDHAEKQGNKVIKWRIPVELDAASGEYYIQFPDDLLERTGWKENDKINWVDNKDGTFTLTKYTKPLGMDEC